MMSHKSSPWIVIMIIMIISVNANSQIPRLFNSTLGIGGSSHHISLGTAYLVQQSIGQASVIGTFNRYGHSLRQGFIQPHMLRSAEHKDDLALAVTVYPNPFTNKLIISLPELSDSKIQILITDLQGRAILYDEKIASKVVVNSESLSAGQYILKMSKGNKLSIIKLVKI